MASLDSQRDLFDVPAEIAYLNTANMSPLLRSVREAGARALAQRAAPWKVTSVDWFTDVGRLRSAYAGVLGVDADGVALVPASSYGLAAAARNLAAASTRPTTTRGSAFAHARRNHRGALPADRTIHTDSSTSAKALAGRSERAAPPRPQTAAGSFTVRQLKGPVGNTIGIAAHPPGYPGGGSPERAIWGWPHRKTPGRAMAARHRREQP
jgi:hypothetical protein